MKTRNLGWVKLNDQDYKLAIKDGCVVARIRGKPRDEVSLSVEEIAGHVVSCGRKHVGKSRKQIDYPEFAW